MEKKAKEPRGFFVEKGSFFAHAAVTILILSIVARLLGTMNLWGGEFSKLLVQVLLPIGCQLLFILFILLLGRMALWSTILPVLGGAAFFILSVLDNGFGWTMFICIALAFLAAFVYTATLSGMINNKWLISLVFTLIFAYQIIFRAIPVFSNTLEPVSFVNGMLLLSSMGMILAMLCASLAFRRKISPANETELPKIKDPVVIKPSEKESTDISDKADCNIAEPSLPETESSLDSDSLGVSETNAITTDDNSSASNLGNDSEKAD